MIVFFGGNIYVITETIIGADVMFTDCIDDNGRVAGPLTQDNRGYRNSSLRSECYSRDERA